MSSSRSGDRQKKIRYKKQSKRPAKRPWAIVSGGAVIFKALVVAIPVALILESIGIADLTRVRAYTNPYTDPYVGPLKDRWAEFWNRGEVDEAIAVVEPEALPEKVANEAMKDKVADVPVVEFASADQEEIVLASEPAEPDVEPDAKTVVSPSSDSMDDRAIVTTYRATFFSDHSSIGAAERPITRGTRVKILQRQDDWVKVQAMDSQEIGFIHESHLE